MLVLEFLVLDLTISVDDVLLMDLNLITSLQYELLLLLLLLLFLLLRQLLLLRLLLMLLLLVDLVILACLCGRLLFLCVLLLELRLLLKLRLLGQLSLTTTVHELRLKQMDLVVKKVVSMIKLRFLDDPDMRVEILLAGWHLCRTRGLWLPGILLDGPRTQQICLRGKLGLRLNLRRGRLGTQVLRVQIPCLLERCMACAWILRVSV